MHKDIYNLIQRLERSQSDAAVANDMALARLLHQAIDRIVLDDEEKYRPVEVHVTIAPAPIEIFQKACRDLEVKPLVLMLFDQNGAVIQEDMLTACRVNTIDHGLHKSEQLMIDLEHYGLDVIRRKVEIHPTFEEVYPPTHYTYNTMYVESHLDIKVDFMKHSLARLFAILTEHQAMPSSNISKLDTIIATTRAFEGGLTELHKRNHALVRDLQSNGFDVGDVETEMAVYDNNFYHDRVWAEKVLPRG